MYTCVFLREMLTCTAVVSCVLNLIASTQRVGNSPKPAQSRSLRTSQFPNHLLMRCWEDSSFLPHFLGAHSAGMDVCMGDTGRLGISSGVPVPAEGNDWLRHGHGRMSDLICTSGPAVLHVGQADLRARQGHSLLCECSPPIFLPARR